MAVFARSLSLPLSPRYPMWSCYEYWGRQQRIVNNNLSDIKGPDSGTGESPQRAKDKINSGYVKALHIST